MNPNITERRKRFKLDQRLDPETVARLVAECEAGVPSTHLAKSYGLSKGSVLNILRTEGVKVRRQSLSPADVETAAVLYQSGLSLKRVGERLDVSLDAVRNALIRADVPIRPRPGWDYNAQ